MKRYVSTKAYLFCGSTVFRQWHAKSHCRVPHGYSLSIFLEFEATVLDENNWVMDFGALGPVKKFLDNLLDHTWVVAADDPKLDTITRFLRDLEALDKLRIVPTAGCEGIASYIQDFINSKFLMEYDPVRVRCRKVEVREHERNSGWVEDVR